VQELIDALDRHQAEIIHVGQFDYASIFRMRRYRRAAFLEWASEPRFPNVLPYWDQTDDLWGGTAYFPQEVTIDTGSIRRSAAESGAVTLMCEFGGTERPLMPRAVLRRQLERATAMGFDVDAAFEFEALILDETDVSLREKNFSDLKSFNPGHRCWSGVTHSVHAEFFAGMEAEILGHDIALYALTTELGPGCHEITLGHSRGLRAADDAALLRTAVQSFARKQGKTASFMAYLGDGLPGTGGHCTMSLRDRQTGRNLFASDAAETTQLAGRFIAGMMKIVPQAFALCTSTTNAFRRLAPGSWAPKSLTWAEHPHTVAVRSVPNAGDRARLEFRVPPSDNNTYLTMALMLGAGLDGIEQQLDIPAQTLGAHPDFIPEGAERFPRDLAEAADRLERSADAVRLFGAEFVTGFAATCRHEFAALARAVSAAERARYLEG
jgi:glutamine synthetase